ncbi:hypothetical protein [Spirulina major]|nr:hypothetical protein [Spirulina major]
METHPDQTFISRVARGGDRVDGQGLKADSVEYYDGLKNIF